MSNNFVVPLGQYRLGNCSEAAAWLQAAREDGISLADALQDCPRYEWALWYAGQVNTDTKWDLARLALKYAAQVIPELESYAEKVTERNWRNACDVIHAARHAPYAVCEATATALYYAASCWPHKPHDNTTDIVGYYAAQAALYAAESAGRDAEVAETAAWKEIVQVAVQAIGKTS